MWSLMENDAEPKLKKRARDNDDSVSSEREGNEDSVSRQTLTTSLDLGDLRRILFSELISSKTSKFDGFNEFACLELDGVIAHQPAASNLSCLKEVNIDVDLGASHQLQVFANVRSLVVCSTTLEVSSFSFNYGSLFNPDLLNTKSPCLDNLVSLTVNVKNPSPLYQKPLIAAKSKKAQLKPPSSVPDRAVDYLIQNSPFAKVTMKIAEGKKNGKSSECMIFIHEGYRDALASDQNDTSSCKRVVSILQARYIEQQMNIKMF